MISKQKIREEIKGWRNSLPDWDLTRRSVLVGERLFDLPEFKKAETIMIYNSKASEVKTDIMVQRALAMGKTVTVPVMNTLEYCLFLSEMHDPVEELEEGAFKVPEPKEEYIRPVNSHTVDIFVLPGVAFDIRGNRLGFGGGYFDKLLKQTKKGALFVGMSFSDQLVAEIPSTPHDIPVHRVITDRETINCTNY